MLVEVEEYEKGNMEELKRLVALGGGVRRALWRSEFGRECGEIYDDLCGAEEVLRGNIGEEKAEGDADEELHRVTSLERAAYTTLHLLQELSSSSSQVSSMTGATPMSKGEITNTLPSLTTINDADTNGVIMEKSRFLMKLAPRIRRLESDTAKCLVNKLEELLTCVRNDLMESDTGEGDISGFKRRERKEELLLMIGNCLRGLALLGKGSDAESAFARVAIM